MDRALSLASHRARVRPRVPSPPLQIRCSRSRHGLTLQLLEAGLAFLYREKSLDVSARSGPQVGFGAGCSSAQRPSPRCVRSRLALGCFQDGCVDSALCLFLTTATTISLCLQTM